MSTAAHRQTGYVAAPRFSEPAVLEAPEPTEDLEQAKRDLTESGMCLVSNVLSREQIDHLKEKLSAQAAAERALGELAPAGAHDSKQIVANMVNKGRDFLSLVEHPITDELAGYMLGRQFLLSSLTGHLFNSPTSQPQQLHRDQGQVPATVDFPAACNVFWLLDDYTAKDGSTLVIPGSHRWPAEAQINPPDPDQAIPLTAKAGTVFAWDGRLWHGTGVSQTGRPRRAIAIYCCLPWMRQQENWGVTCLQEVLDAASDKLKARLGLRTYGTLGGMSGTGSKASLRSLGNNDVVIPDYIIGEDAELFPTRRVTREEKP